MRHNADVNPAEDFYKGRKILHLCAVDFTARHFLAPTAFDQKKRGAIVGIICCNGPDYNFLEEQGMKMIPLAIPRSLSPLKLIRESQKLREILIHEKPDILHVHTPIAGLLGRLIGKISGVKTILYTVHGFTFHENSTRISWLLHFSIEWFFSFFHTAIICVSAEDARTAKRTKFQAPGGISCIPNGVDPENYAAPNAEVLQCLRAELGVQPEQRVVAFFGRINHEKGTREFVEAAVAVCQQFPDVVALLVGPTLNSEREHVLDDLSWLIAEHGMEERIRFTGYRHDVPKLLYACEVFCLPSWREGFPVTVLEAMMTGRAIVATKIRGIREMIRNEQEGLLVPIKNSTALAEALTRLLSDSDLATQLGKQAQVRAVANYTLALQLQRTKKVYKKILGRKRS